MSTGLYQSLHIYSHFFELLNSGDFCPPFQYPWNNPVSLSYFPLYTPYTLSISVIGVSSVNHLSSHGTRVALSKITSYSFDQT